MENGSREASIALADEMSSQQSLWSSARRARVVCSMLLVIVLGGALLVRGWLIRESLPYCRHVDEKTWVQIAMRMMRDGDLNPHRFTKPSVMVYTTTAGMSLGLIRSSSKQDTKRPRDLGKRAYPYYKVPSAVEVPKLLFALASVLGMGMAGLCARMLGRKEWLVVLAPVLCCGSATYLFFSWEYINADIIGACFILATITNLLVGHQRHPEGADGLDLAIVQGVLVGFTLGCKYNLFPIAVPYLLYVALYVRHRAVSRGVTFLVAMSAGFVLSTPYSLFALNELLHGAAAEASHYASDHRGKFTPSGWPMLLKYLGDLRDSYGMFTLLVALLGVGRSLRNNWRLALVAFSFPVAFLAYMSNQRVFFERNGVSVHLFVAIAAAIGLDDLLRLARLATERNRVLSRLRPWSKRALVYSPLSVFIALFPWQSVWAAHSLEIESRRTVVRELPALAAKGSALLVDKRLNLDARPLDPWFRVSSFDGDKKRPAKLADKVKPGTIIVTPAGNRILIENLMGKGAEVLLRAGTRRLRRDGHANRGDPKLVVLRR